LQKRYSPVAVFGGGRCCGLVEPGVHTNPILVARMVDDFGIITPLQQHGGYRKNAGRPPKNAPPREKKPRTKSDQSHYVLRRLVRDAGLGVRDAAILLRGILTGQISEYAAGVEYGICKRREPTGCGSENRTRANDWAMHRLFNPRPVRVPGRLDYSECVERTESHGSGGAGPSDAEASK
jgi:hypothetical protein